MVEFHPFVFLSSFCVVKRDHYRVYGVLGSLSRLWDPFWVKKLVEKVLVFWTSFELFGDEAFVKVVSTGRDCGQNGEGRQGMGHDRKG